MGNLVTTPQKSATLPRKNWGINNRKKPKNDAQAENSRVLFLLYLINRTWNIVVEHVDSRSVSRWKGSRRHLDSESDLRDSDLASQYSFCSCSNCKCNEECTSQCSDLSCKGDLSDSMAPNSAQGHRGGWPDEASKEKQRPPTYNPEDYAAALRKWTKRGNTHSGVPPPSHPALVQGEHQTPGKPNKHQHSDKDYRNPCLSPGGEMSLRQFGSLSELLTKLRADLRLAFPSFVQEFIGEPLDGVNLIVEALRTIQLSQTGPTTPTLPMPGNVNPGAVSPAPRLPPAVQRRILLDELACLQCLQSCCQRYPESARRLVACPAGLYALATCIMSTVNKSRVIALQLLTTACDVSQQGHCGVSEALSTLRLRYGEPCRFRFLAGMLQSGAGGEELPAAGLKLLAALLGGAPTPQRKLYLQAELDQAGLDVVAIKKAVARNTPGANQVLAELARYEQQLIDVDGLSEKATEAEKEKDTLKNKLDLLEKRVKILQEEKGILLSLEQCLKERCCELQEEVTSLRSEHGNSGKKKSLTVRTTKRDESSPPEDEGISSSERSLSPDGELQREPMVYEVFNVKNETILMRSSKNAEKCIKPTEQTKVISDDEDETTIEEVIEELRNIINDAESEQYAKEKILADEKMSKYKQQSEIIVSVKAVDSRQHSDLEKKDSITSTKHNIIITDPSDYRSNRSNVDSDTEIIPVKILPKPPRKSKSLVHLYIPSAQQGVICKNELPFEEDNHYYTSDEGSDSLLSASKCQPQVRREVADVYIKTNNRALLNSIMDARERAMAADQQRELSKRKPRPGEEVDRRPSMKRNESFKKINKSADDLGDRYYSDENTPYNAINKHENNRKDNYESTLIRQRDDYSTLVESKKLTKSLDRMDDGLNSMVDIVLTSDNNNKQYERNNKITQMHSNMDLARDSTGNIVVRSPSKRRLSRNVRSRQDSRNSSKINNQDVYDTNHQSSDSSHRLYFPSSRINSNSYDQIPANNGNNAPFVIKTGRTNVGLYSDQNYINNSNNRDRVNNYGSSRLQSMALSGKAFERTLSPSGMRNTGNNYNILGKLTDIPSGLY